MTIDVLTVGAGFFSFIVFLVIHFITFRWVRPEHLLKSLLGCVIAMMACPIVLIGILYSLKVVNATLGGWVCAAVLASVIQGLLCFVYVLCIFGPYETSVRMRLVREIAASAGNGVSLQELLSRYNPETLVNIRLQRLVGSGDLIEKDGRFRLGRSKNFFFVFDAIAGVIKKWIGR